MKPTPLSQGRVWTACLWAAIMAAGLGTLHEAWLHADRRASEQAALLIPATELGQEQRERALAEIQSKPETREAAWISPSELARETGKLLPPEQWPEMLSEEDAWLPWVLEVRWRDPLLRHSEIATRVEAFRLDAQWKIVLWNHEVLMNRRQAVLKTLMLGGSALGLVLLMGALALATGPVRQCGWLAEGFTATILAWVFVGVFSAVAMLEGIYPDEITWGIAGTTAFLLAGVVAPMIKRQRSMTDSTPTMQATEESAASSAEPTTAPEAPEDPNITAPESPETLPQPSEEPQNASK